MIPSNANSSRRSFVFLQGPTSPVFRELGRALHARGHRVLRINLCPGDWLFWRGDDTRTYGGLFAKWPGWLARRIEEQDATDLIYFGDRFPYHRVAQNVAREMGVRAVAMEYGYLRPDWIIFEEEGHGRFSHFPAEPDFIRQTAATLPPVDMKPRFTIPGWQETLFEPLFHLSNLTAPLFTPGYAPDRYYPEWHEFPSYIPRFARRARARTATADLIATLLHREGPTFLVPLQMQNDYQLRDNAPAGYQHGFIDEVLASFARAAPTGAKLLFKLHPNDNGIERWDRFVPARAAFHGVSERVDFLDGATLDDLFPHVAGCVTINSTSGLHALQAGLATKTLGTAIYDMPGLTHRGPLDAFWTEPVQPEADLTEALLRCLAHGIHLRGAVYGREGRGAFVSAAVARLESKHLHQHQLYRSQPPRLTQERQ